MRSSVASDEFNIPTYGLKLEGLDVILSYINRAIYGYELKFHRKPKAVTVPCKIYMAINLAIQKGVPLYMDGTVAKVQQILGLNLLPSTSSFICLIPDDRDIMWIVTADMEPKNKTTQGGRNDIKN